MHPDPPDAPMIAGRSSASWRALIPALVALSLIVASCGGDDTNDSAAAGPDASTSETLRIGAIPDQEPERLQRTYGLLSDYLSDSLGVAVEYVPVTDYQGAVSAFRVGDLDLVWFGALTGVQARLEVDGAEAVAQRNIDTEFTSVFIARADAGIEPFDDVAGLAAVAGRSLTFGSESSTSGRLMPQSFLSQAGVTLDDLAGAPGFSGSHDATIELVTAGTFEVGTVSSEVWDSRVAEGVVDTDTVIEIFRTPQYVNYHWVSQPALGDRFGDGFDAEVLAALMALDPGVPEHAEILDLFGADSFIATESSNYAAVEEVGRDIGLIRSP